MWLEGSDEAVKLSLVSNKEVGEWRDVDEESKHLYLVALSFLVAVLFYCWTAISAVSCEFIMDRWVVQDTLGQLESMNRDHLMANCQVGV